MSGYQNSRRDDLAQSSLGLPHELMSHWQSTKERGRQAGSPSKQYAAVRKENTRTWPSCAAVWTSFSTVSRIEQFFLRKTQSDRPQQQCSAEEAGS